MSRRKQESTKKNTVEVQFDSKSEKRRTRADFLSPKEKTFCIKYVELGNGIKACEEAGYSSKSYHGLGVKANHLLKKDKIKKQIDKLLQEKNSESIANGQEVMKYFTSVMRGEINDQFGLEAPLSERTKAAQEIAKRTIDIENRQNGQADAKVEINLNWRRD